MHISIPFFVEPAVVEIPVKETSQQGSWFHAFLLCFVPVFFTYGGYQQTMNFGGDVKNPRRAIPKAIVIGIGIVLTKNNVIHTINRVGSMISVHFDANPVTDFNSAKKGDNETFKKFFHGLLNEGIYIAPSAYETWFITDALTYEDLDCTINAVNQVSTTL